MTFQFQGNKYANEPEMWGRFHHQRISCSSDFEEARPTSCFSNAYSSLTFVLRKLLQDDVLLLINCFRLLRQKIASEGEGRKPSSNREKYIAESEFALLGILSKSV